MKIYWEKDKIKALIIRKNKIVEVVELNLMIREFNIKKDEFFAELNKIPNDRHIKYKDTECVFFSINGIPVLVGKCLDRKLFENVEFKNIIKCAYQKKEYYNLIVNTN